MILQICILGLTKYARKKNAELQIYELKQHRRSSIQQDYKGTNSRLCSRIAPSSTVKKWSMIATAIKWLVAL